MNVRILLTMVLLLVMNFAWARQEDPSTNVEEITTELSLSPLQVRKWTSTIKATATKLEAIKNSDAATEEKRAQVKQLREDRDTKLESIVSAPQWAKYVAYREKKAAGN